MKTITSLFETPIEPTTPAILLVDFSGSTGSQFLDKQTIFDKMFDVIKSHIKHKKFQFIFWSSEAFVYPDIVDDKHLNLAYNYAKTLQGCSTLPDRGFKAIPKEWISNKEATHIYFVTDGEIDSGIQHRNDLADQIRLLFANYNNVHLHIMTVESRTIDFGSLENVNRMAGADVYQVLKNQSLTGRITEFTTWSRNQSAYTHITNVIAPSGFVPFGSKYFSEAKMDLFVTYLFDLIQESKSNEDELLKIVQSLSATLKNLLNDKPIKIQAQITQTFCDLFEGTCLDPCIIRFILVDTIKNEQNGKAMVIAEYRGKLKDLFKQANDLLFQDTQNAIGMVTEFMTFPVNDVILVGNSALVQETIKMNKSSYPNSSVKVNSLTIPALPLHFNAKSLLNQQCLRQYMRAIIAQLYGLNPLDDLIIYVVLGISLKVSLSNIKNQNVVIAWRNLAKNMLLKKRLNSTQTEWDRIQTGELPIPNSGKIQQFYDFMDKVGQFVGISCKPLSLWYAMCLNLGDEKIAAKQLIHCHEDISRDFGKDADLLKAIKIKSGAYQSVELPIESVLDYKCSVTSKDCSETGGFRILPHKKPHGGKCCPNSVISEVGLSHLGDKKENVCPACFAVLDKKDFVKIGKRSGKDFVVFDGSVKNPFLTDHVTGIRSRIITKDPIKGIKESVPVFTENKKIVVKKDNIVNQLDGEYVVNGKNFRSDVKKIKDLLSVDKTAVKVVGYGFNIDQTCSIVNTLKQDGIQVEKIETLTVQRDSRDLSGIRFVLK